MKSTYAGPRGPAADPCRGYGGCGRLSSRTRGYGNGGRIPPLPVQSVAQQMSRRWSANPRLPACAAIDGERSTSRLPWQAGDPPRILDAYMPELPAGATELVDILEEFETSPSTRIEAVESEAEGTAAEEPAVESGADEGMPSQPRPRARLPRVSGLRVYYRLPRRGHRAPSEHVEAHGLRLCRCDKGWHAYEITRLA